MKQQVTTFLTTPLLLLMNQFGSLFFFWQYVDETGGKYQESV